jgi:Fe-S cluster biogenesis protein NfuA
MIVNKKKGKTMCSCGGGCSGCPMGDKCGKK